jgi:hypothetical protein
LLRAQLDLKYNSLGTEGGKALAAALKSNTTLTTLDVSENGVSFIDGIRIDQALRANTRGASYARLLADTVPATRLKLHLCGDGGAGKTTLSSALRRTAAGALLLLLKPSKWMATDKPTCEEERTRGVEVKRATLDGRACTLWDYGAPD